MLGDRRAVKALADRLASDPYVPVRAEIAEVLGTLGDRAALPALQRAALHETESQVTASIRAAIALLSKIH